MILTQYKIFFLISVFSPIKTNIIILEQLQRRLKPTRKEDSMTSKFETLDTYWGHTYALCQQVLSETKPAAFVTVRNEYLPELTKLIEDFKLRYSVRHTAESGKVALWIFKYFHLHSVIDTISDYVEQGLHGTVQYWMLLKLLGCSDRYIDEYFIKLAEEVQ